MGIRYNLNDNALSHIKEYEAYRYFAAMALEQLVGYL